LFTTQSTQIKPPFIMKLHRIFPSIILAAVASFAMATQSHAAQIIDFDVTTSGGGGGAVSSDSNYSLSTAWVTSSSVPAQFTVSGLPTHGGFYTSEGDVARWQSNIGAEFRLGDNVNANVEAAMVWTKSNFLNGGDTNAVTIDSSSSFSINAGLQNVDTGEPTLRWALVDGATTYVSELVTPTWSQGSFSTTSSGDLTSLDWFEFTPSADASTAGTLGTIAGTTATPDFTDIDGVGFYTASTVAKQSSALSVQGFTVNVTVIPEPSATLLLLSACGALLLLRRRR
jgi:hypothetical protein